MAKRACFTLPAVAATLLCMTGCAQNGGFTLALNSKAFSMSIGARSAPSLDTYRREGEGDVPYVKLSQYAEALGNSMSHTPYSVRKEGSTFTVCYVESDQEGAPKHALFRFDAFDGSLTYLGGAKCQSRYYATRDGQGNTIENDAGIPVDYRIPPSFFYNREAINASLDKLR